MRRSGLGIAGLLAAWLAVTAAAAAAEPPRADDPSLPIYKLVRTLEYVQDSIVNGDHAAMEMQRFLLGQIDERLRHADEAVFEDPRNVDAALIYAMSGGNPATLVLLESRDVEGYFDHRLVSDLSNYFTGKPDAAAADLVAMEPDFRQTAIGAYLTLVTANAVAPAKPKEALKLFDWVRLLAPGSILEESALRRSITVASHAHLIREGMAYCDAYARRFLHSPYAGQFADLLVGLVVDNDNAVSRDDLMAVLAGMDVKRQRAVYLRIARQATIKGKRELAEDAARRARALPEEDDTPAPLLANLYAGISNLSTADVEAAMARIEAIPAAELSERDRRLRAAALAVGHAVTTLPDAASLEQAKRAKLAASADARGAAADDPPSQPIPSRPAVRKETGVDPARLASFVDEQRSRLKEIDALLGKTGR